MIVQEHVLSSAAVAFQNQKITDISTTEVMMVISGILFEHSITFTECVCRCVDRFQDNIDQNVARPTLNSLMIMDKWY